MTVALQNLHFGKPNLKDYFRWRVGRLRRRLLGWPAVRRSVVAWVWRGEPLAALVIGLSVLLSVLAAGIIGMSIPTLLHAIHEDSKIAAGPITLATTDILTLVFYFNIATVLLG